MHIIPKPGEGSEDEANLQAKFSRMLEAPHVIGQPAQRAQHTHTHTHTHRFARGTHTCTQDQHSKQPQTQPEYARPGACAGAVPVEQIRDVFRQAPKHLHHVAPWRTRRQA